MSITYVKEKGAYRFSFDRKIGGKPIRATKLLPKGWTREEAEAYDLKQTQELYKKYEGIAQSRPKIESAVLAYLQSDRCKKRKTYKTIMAELHRLEPFYKGRYLDELPEVCEQISAIEYHDNPRLRKARVLSPASKRKKIRTLTAACNWAFKYKKMGKSKPSEGVAIPEVNNARERYPTRSEMLRLARFTKRKGARCVIITAFYSGMRQDEILRASVEDGLFKLYDTKNGTMRFVPIHPKLNVYLKRFPHPATYDSVRYWMDKGRSALNLGHYRFHDLRHSTASEMINQGVDLFTVGKVLGHKSVVSTNIYSHLVTSTLKAALMKVGKRIKE